MFYMDFSFHMKKHYFYNNYMHISDEPRNLRHTHIQCDYKWMVQLQKLKRNLFLNLHGHNVHRQQRQLSKFLMRYQQFAFHAYCGAAMVRLF